MADDLNGDKTEQPTDKRRTEVREQGQVAKSSDLTAAVLLLAVGMAMRFGGGDLVQSLGRMLESTLSEKAWLTIDTALVYRRFLSMLFMVLAPITLMLGTVAASVIGINLLQTGFLWSPQSILPDWGRVNPWSGLQRILSTRGAVRLVGSLGKLSLLAGVTIWVLSSRLMEVGNLMRMPVPEGAAYIGYALTDLAIWIGGSLLVLALLDYGYQWWQFEQDLRMTKQEIREEHRQMEGDPLIRQRRREAHRKLAQSRQLQGVKTADAVVTNPTELAVAIKYDPKTMGAPIIVAKGQDLMAARIRRIAAEHGVPIIERKPLARALFKLRVGDAVPVELYDVVAELLAYVYRLKKQFSGRIT